MIVGNDVSKFQGDIDYGVYKNNTNFVISKATEGVGFTDVKFNRNQSEARNAGLLRGFYHFARPDLGNTPEAEADYFLSVIGQLQEGEILALDYECAKQSQAHVDWCKGWLDHIFAKTGCKPLIYMSESVVLKFDWTSVVNAGYGLWIAKYARPPKPDTVFNPGKWPFAAMYQWSSSQLVPGILNGTGNVDANVFYGDSKAFIAYGYHVPQPTPPPTPDPDPEKVIAGLRSRITDLDKQLASANAEVENRDQQVSRLKDQVLESDKLRQDVLKQLNDATKKVEAITTAYEGQLRGKQELIDAQGKQLGAQNTRIAVLEAENKGLKAGLVKSLTLYQFVRLKFGVKI